MDDWNPEPTFAPTGPVPVPSQNETYREDWPVNLKWGVNGETNEPEVWRVYGGIDGRPAHRGHLRELWGRDVNGQAGDTMGLAMHKPAQTLLDGTVVKPASVKVVTYYGKQLPPSISQWFARTFPNAQLSDVGQDLAAMQRDSKLADTFDPMQPYQNGEAHQLKWAWHPNDGTLLWRTDERGLPGHDNMRDQTWGRSERDPLDRTGWIDESEGDHSIEQHFGLPPAQCISDVKSELARQIPEARIRMPETQEDHGIEESFGTDGPRIGALYARLLWPGGSEKDAEGRVLPRTDTEPHLGYITLAGADMSGARVAVYIPEEVGRKLLQDHTDAEPIERMHVTLAYFKDKADERDDWDEVEKIVSGIAARTPKLTGKISGFGVFNTGEEGDVLWASPSVDGLAELRDDVVEAVEKAGFEISREHGWAPHITLQYGFEGSLPKLKGGLDVSFDSLAFARGEDKNEHSFAKSGKHLALGNYKPHAIPFVTDGKNLKIDMRPDEFLRMYPPEHRDYPKAHADLSTGWIVETDDGLGYGIQGGVGLRPDQPGAHEVVKLLDEETGKPCHFIMDEGSSWSSLPTGSTAPTV